MRDEALGELLIRLRSEKGCGLRWASQGIGVSPSELSKFERGYANPSPETLQAIATFYGADVDTLAALVVEPPPMLGKMGIHIAGASDMSDATVAALLELGRHVTPAPAALVAAFQARELAEEVRERAITSLRWAVEPDDYDQLMAMGDLGGAELW